MSNQRLHTLSAMPLPDWRGAITTFKGFRGTRPVQELANLTWRELATVLAPRNPALFADKQHAQYFVPCLLRDAALVGQTLEAAIHNGQATTGKMRSKTHVTEASMLIMDIDGFSEADFMAGLAKIGGDGLVYLAYTTHSHGRADKPGIRARIVIPLDHLVNANDYTIAWHGFDLLYWNGQAGQADSSGANLYQQQGTSCCHPDRVNLANAWRVLGGVASSDALIAAGMASHPAGAALAVKASPARVSNNHAVSTGGIRDSTNNDYPPSDAAKIAAACKQIGHFRDTKGADQKEPVWFDCLGITAFCVDGAAISHDWSSGHAEYDERATDRKLTYRMRTAPTTCAQFKISNPAGCQGCHQRCNSPITLGWADAFDVLETEVVIPPSDVAPAKKGKARQTDQGDAAEPETIGNAPPAIAILNERFAFIEKDAAIYRIEYGDFVDPPKFRLQHNNQTVLVNKKYVAVGSAWLNWPYRRQHKALVIRPGEDLVTGDNCLNEWKGFAIPAVAGNIRPFVRLFVWLVPDRPARRYMQRWLAHLIQHPGVKMFVSIAVWSHAQGVGKNLLFETPVGIIGAAHATVIGQTELTSSFNDWANRRIFVVGDEVSGNDKRQENDKLKGLITGSTVHVNQKYQPDREQPNLLNFVFLSNHHDALFFNDHDRRFFVWEVEAGPLPQGMVNEFVAWRDSGGLAALHYLLLRLPLSDFNPKAPAPMTTAKQQMADDNRSDLEAWVNDLMASDVAVELGRELATANEIGRKYELDTEHKAPSSKAIVGACKRQGAYARPSQVRLGKDKKVRLLALARPEYWKAQPESAWAAEMEKAFTGLVI